jgi:hypothetical protein
MLSSIIKSSLKKTSPQDSRSQEASTLSIVRSIKNKLSDNNLILSKADKGNTVAILKREDYVKLQMLSVSNPTTIPLSLVYKLLKMNQQTEIYGVFEKFFNG